MQFVSDYLPKAVNSGVWLTRYTLNELKQQIAGAKIVLPVCSLGTPVKELESLGDLVLPPLYHEALTGELKRQLLDRIHCCFPYYAGTRDRTATDSQLEVIELPANSHKPRPAPQTIAFSVDTAVEEHGPHLPLMTDTIQSYGVLQQLESEFSGLVAGPPVEYGHLTWGLPFGLSIDLTPVLLTQYVTGFANAIQDWVAPESMYVVDVHGSIVHRRAIEAGLENSRVKRWSFRWLHEPLVEFAGDRGDQHAGGVETALVEQINPALVDANWWPERLEEIVADEMDLNLAIDLSADMTRFIETVESGNYNGIVGRTRNYHDVDSNLLFERMMHVARSDVQWLRDGESANSSAVSQQAR